MDELAVERLRRRGDVGDDELLEIRDQSPVLAVAVQGNRGAAVDLDGLGVIDGEDFVADFILAVEEVVRFGRRDADLIDVVGAYFLPRIGVSQPSMSDGLTPLRWPPKLKVTGL